MEQSISIASEADLSAAYDRIDALKAAPGWSEQDPEYRAWLEAILAWRLRRPTTQVVAAQDEPERPRGQQG